MDETKHKLLIVTKEGRRVGVFHVNDGFWTDVGNRDEYLTQFVK